MTLIAGSRYSTCTCSGHMRCTNCTVAANKVTISLSHKISVEVHCTCMYGTITTAMKMWFMVIFYLGNLL